MAMYSTNEFKSGLKVMIEGDPCSIVENEFVKPGKGQAFNRVKYRNLRTGRTLEKTFKSGDSLEGADVSEVDMQFLYSDGEFWHFMASDTFEQYVASKQVMQDSRQWIKEQDTCIITIWNGHPLLVTPPNFVNLKVVETEPGIKGDTVSGGNKTAKLETGAVIRVPLFVDVDDVLRVDTRSGEYVSRVKE